MIKRNIVGILVIFTLLFVVGCFEYKAQPASQEDPGVDAALIDEIAQIEAELGLAEEGEATEEQAVDEMLEGDAVAQDAELDALEGELEEMGEEEDTVEELPEQDELSVEEEVVLPELDEEPIQSTQAKVITVKENELLSLNPTITDPDEDEITYTFSKPLDEQGKWQTSYGDAGEYLVTLLASDGELTSTQELKIVVERVNVAPIISGILDLVIDEGDSVALNPKVEDPNNDPVSVEISAPLQEGAWDTDHTSAGQYNVVVTAHDGELETTETITLTVNDVNVLPELLGFESSIEVNEGETVTIQPQVSDLDGDNIELTVSEPVGNDGVWETSFTDNGEYVITITADDGKDIVTEKVTVTVHDVNMPPEIIDVVIATS